MDSNYEDTFTLITDTSMSVTVLATLSKVKAH